MSADRIALTADLLNQLIDDISARTAERVLAALAIKAPEDQTRNPHIPEGLRYPVTVTTVIDGGMQVRTARLAYANGLSMDTAAIEAIRIALGYARWPDAQIKPDPAEAPAPVLPIRCAECNDPIVPSVRGWVHVFDNSGKRPHLWPRLQPSDPIGPVQDPNTPDQPETPPDEQQAATTGYCRYCWRAISWGADSQRWHHIGPWGEAIELCGIHQVKRLPGDQPTIATPR